MNIHSREKAKDESADLNAMSFFLRRRWSFSPAALGGRREKERRDE
jgi:hypothetical protein